MFDNALASLKTRCIFCHSILTPPLYASLINKIFPDCFPHLPFFVPPKPAYYYSLHPFFRRNDSDHTLKSVTDFGKLFWRLRSVLQGSKLILGAIPWFMGRDPISRSSSTTAAHNVLCSVGSIQPGFEIDPRRRSTKRDLRKTCSSFS